MVSRIHTITFQGIEALDIEVQTQFSTGMVAFQMVGLPDKAVAESRERVRSALHALGLSLPAKRITVNLSPADLLKEGSHFDLPIALGILSEMGILPIEEMDQYLSFGELALDGSILSVRGALPAAMRAMASDRGLICPRGNAAEASWAGKNELLPAGHLLEIINHFKGSQLITPPKLETVFAPPHYELDLKDVRGQESAKRALEIVAAGGHNMLMVGPPGAGKSMLAARLPTLLPPLTSKEALEVTTIHSVAGMLPESGIVTTRPYRAPHHSASTAALVGGGQKAKPGELSLAHYGVLFLDELPEFNRQTLEALRQPLENNAITVSRANYHYSYPAKIQLIAAMNPCRCGYLSNAELACAKAPLCAEDYQAKLSGPLLDRFDCWIEVEAVDPKDLTLKKKKEGESSQIVAARVLKARELQYQRFKANGGSGNDFLNADVKGDYFDAIIELDEASETLLHQAAERFNLSARAYHRTLRLARTIADLAGVEQIGRAHIAEALGYRRTSPYHRKRAV